MYSLLVFWNQGAKSCFHYNRSFLIANTDSFTLLCLHYRTRGIANIGMDDCRVRDEIS